MNTQMGPDRAIYYHWLDREPRAVIDVAAVLRAIRRRFGAPNAGVRREAARTICAWQSGFDRFTVTVYKKGAA